MSLTITKQKSGGIAIVGVGGKLDAQTSPQLNDELKALIGTGQTKIIIDMKDLSYISSAGLGVLNQNQLEAKKGGGAIRLSGLQPQVKDVFDLMKFSLLFPMAATPADAAAGF